jgi:hypothetical protein
MRTSCLQWVELARPRVGSPVRAPAGALALRAKVPCAARLSKAAPDLALAWPGRCCAARLCSELDILAVAPSWGGAMPLESLRCSAPSTREQSCLPAALPAPSGHADGAPRWWLQSRGWVCVGSDICGAEERRAGGRARQRATCSDSSRLSERSERSERSEFRDGPCDRVPQGTRSEAQGCRIRAPAHTHPRLCPLNRSRYSAR